MMLETFRIELKEKHIFLYMIMLQTIPVIGNIYVFYGQIRKLEEFTPKHGKIYSWLTFKQMIKLSILDQAKQDLMVSRAGDSCGREQKRRFM